MTVITVHRPVEDTRRVTLQVQPGGPVHDLGRVYHDADLAEVLRRAGLQDAEDLIDVPGTAIWEGEGPYVWGSGQPRPPTARPGR
ncbi:hypothetical protein OG897_30450 [Streptomyces sp. NBC_00237]|uniref:hypothetical protein n=1 Tax=Streptomyces sp. NBC_00237 TaxID=2975687 RepID=UPI002259F407|nr:hypothetical protein [Streptomyces sp. NBC_00237]MCX5205760.1 hypothetical protein [Streptomyces sp. NBC_00237]